MVIEFLKFRVDPSWRETFIQKDAAIWTTALAKYPGFLGKEVWINPHDSTEVVFVIHWQSREQWKAIPVLDLQSIEQEFSRVMANGCELVESGEYQVRKFPHS